MSREMWNAFGPIYEGMLRTHQGIGFEVCTWMLYDRQFYIAGKTERLSFFQQTNGGAVPWGVGTDMQLAGCLPNPQGFLIESIRVYGVTSKIACAAVHLNIGNKVYGIFPAWTLSLKMKGHPLKPNLFIPPQTYFNVNIDFERDYEPYETQGFSRRHAIQVCLYGTIARPIQ